MLETCWSERSSCIRAGSLSSIRPLLSPRTGIIRDSCTPTLSISHTDTCKHTHMHSCKQAYTHALSHGHPSHSATATPPRKATHPLHRSPVVIRRRLSGVRAAAGGQ